MFNTLAKTLAGVAAAAFTVGALAAPASAANKTVHHDMTAPAAVTAVSAQTGGCGVHHDMRCR